VIERFYRWRRNLGGPKPPIHIKPHILKTIIKPPYPHIQDIKVWHYISNHSVCQVYFVPKCYDNFRDFSANFVIK